MAYRQLKLSAVLPNKKLETDVKDIAVASGDGGDKDDGMVIGSLAASNVGDKKAVGAGDVDDKKAVGVGDMDDKNDAGAGDMDDKMAVGVGDIDDN